MLKTVPPCLFAHGDAPHQKIDVEAYSYVPCQAATYARTCWQQQWEAMMETTPGEEEFLQCVYMTEYHNEYFQLWTSSPVPAPSSWNPWGQTASTCSKGMQGGMVIVVCLLEAGRSTCRYYDVRHPEWKFEMATSFRPIKRLAKVISWTMQHFHPSRASSGILRILCAHLYAWNRPYSL